MGGACVGMSCPYKRGQAGKGRPFVNVWLAQQSKVWGVVRFKGSNPAANAVQ